jgi:hypothetical protein
MIIMVIWNPHLLVTIQANFVEALSPAIDVHSAWPSLLSQSKFSQAPKIIDGTDSSHS